jgi:hypothetical protein
MCRHSIRCQFCFKSKAEAYLRSRSKETWVKSRIRQLKVTLLLTNHRSHMFEKILDVISWAHMRVIITFALRRCTSSKYMILGTSLCSKYEANIIRRSISMRQLSFSWSRSIMISSRQWLTSTHGVPFKDVDFNVILRQNGWRKVERNAEIHSRSFLWVYREAGESKCKWGASHHIGHPRNPYAHYFLIVTDQ